MRKVRLSGPPVAEHGRYIYAYCNVRTNQVVYSLTQTLNSNAALRQLPDLGANNKPTSIRKDLWKPLYTLALPSSAPADLAQGLDAFHRLREYRKLRELCWEPPAALSQPYSDVDIEHERKKLQERGGGKKESVYDVIKRRKKGLRVGMVMNQRAKSVADLAAILLAQEKRGQDVEEAVVEERNRDRRNEVEVMLGLAKEAEEGGLGKMDEMIQALQKRTEDPSDALEGTSRGQLRRELYRVYAKKAKIAFAVQAVEDAKSAWSQQGAEGEMQQQEEMAVIDTDSLTPPSKPDFLDRPAKQLAKRFAQNAAQAERGALAAVDASIREAQTELAKMELSEKSEVVWRAQLRVRRVMREQMRLAHEVSHTQFKHGIMDQAQIKNIVRRLRELNLELAQKDVDEVKQVGEEGKLLSSLQQQVKECEDALQRGSMEEVHEDVGAYKRSDVRLSQLATTEQAAAVREYLRKAQTAFADLDNLGTFPQPPPSFSGLTTAELQSAKETFNPTRFSSNPTFAIKATEITTALDDALLMSSLPEWADHLPSFPTRSDATLPKRGPLRQKHKRLNTPIWSTEGVKVKWANLMDVEFAGMWPANVAHEPMGWTRYAAPRGDEEAVNDVAGLSRVPLAEVDAVEAQGEEFDYESRIGRERVRSREDVSFEAGQRRQFVKGVQSRILERVRKLEEGRERKRRVRVGLDSAVTVGQSEEQAGRRGVEV
ncbi:hypothetical protein LTR62_000149 [Meristemomyces frigidus]|uniref:Large ribosomal subunit protein mL67 n=1 Tax=Meristemomyces frigidus TaxID=1508187 RepID=A0AAN7TR24_9PEZI|nr:hypothetical protein LTR62_000149 [Meristemomyces frigidus]